MKKFFATLLLAVVAIAASFGFAACDSPASATIDVYAPDGAPALAIAKLMHENNDFGEGVSYHVVDASTLASRVTAQDESKNADFIIMPVNMASKVLNDGSRYKMLGTVTHGNLFILAKNGTEQLTKENFATQIAGKKVGVINLPEFPGVMFQTLLADYDAEADLSVVVPGDVMGTNTNYDYFVVPEPAAGTKTSNTATQLSFVGSVQELYGEGGYPQAVLMAKNSIIGSKPGLVSEFMEEIAAAATWLNDESVTSDMILNAIKSHYPDPDNTTPAFTNLTKNIISGCAVRFEASSYCKDAVKSILSKFKSVNANFANEVPDSFFHI